MKSRRYFNLYCGREASETYGYPLSLPHFDGIELAIVRPVTWGEHLVENRWQVIHVRSGFRITYEGPSLTMQLAKASAMASIERAANAKGWAHVVRTMKRKKTPCIVAALDALERKK